MITRQDALQYETGRTTFIESQFYAWFPKLFVKKFNKRYLNYQAFMKLKDNLGSTNFLNAN
jgi:hypothetical protein